MITEIFRVSGLGRRLRNVLSPTAGAKKINRYLYDALSAAASVAPTVTTAPVIAGTPAVASVLTCTPGVYAGTPAPTITRQWFRNTTAQGGQTGLTYTVQAGDAGQNISCKEQATNAAGNVISTSNVLAIAALGATAAEDENGYHPAKVARHKKAGHDDE